MPHGFHQELEALSDITLDVAASRHIVESFIIQLRKWVQFIRILIDHLNTVL